MRRKRTVKVGEARIAGDGADGETYCVRALKTSGGPFVHRAKPCATCPWRRDSPVGRFPAQAYRESAPTSYDAGQSTFACHESGITTAATCAGFLLANGDHNLIVRMAQVTGRYDPRNVSNPDDVPLYSGYREMAIANGVAADDPVIAPCRGNNDK